MKPVLLGTVISAFTIAVGALIDSHNILTYLFYVSSALIVLSVVLSGLGADGDRMKANYATVNKGDRQTRLNMSKSVFLLSVPSIIISFLLYLLRQI